jgi:hypothetical protein
MLEVSIPDSCFIRAAHISDLYDKACRISKVERIRRNLWAGNQPYIYRSFDISRSQLRLYCSVRQHFETS